jgi:hypothetical protein
MGMNNKFGRLISFLEHYKYLIVIVLGVLIVGFLDENSLMRDVQYQLQISDLKKQIQEYKERNDADIKRLRELKRNPKAIEKIARERYFMKADDEDIYVLSDDERPIQTNDETIN